MARNASEVRKMLEEELQRARAKHPNWPTDLVRRAMILMDQAAGIGRESLNCLFDGTSRDYLEKEVLHTAVVCVRWLEGG